jgi:acyl-CoA synthetase (NDP forming)
MQETTQMNLTKLIRPKSLAIVGASDRTGSIGQKVVLSSQKWSIAERVYFVNPNKTELLGKPCYKCLADLPELVDCVILCTPKQACPDIVEEAGRLNIKAAMVYASGFSEEGTIEGIELEKKLMINAKKYDIAVLGPNCNGVTNSVDKIYMTMLGYTIDRDRPTGIGIISQSGYATTQAVTPDYMNISYGVSVGNSNIVNLEDIMEFMVEDANVNVIAIYLEGVRNGEKFISMLKRAQEVNKPIVVLKSGRSALGARAAASHTGSMAGSYERYKALLAKYNAVLTETMQEFVYTAMAMNTLIKAGSMPRGDKLAGITLSGAENVMCADMCEACGISLPELSSETSSALADILPLFATPSNPLDATTYYIEKSEEFARLIQTISADEKVDMIAINVEVTENLDKKNMSEVEAIIAARKQGCKTIFAMSTMEATRNLEVRRNLEAIGTPILGPGITGYKILSNIIKYATYDVAVYDLNSYGVPSKSKNAGKWVTLTEAESKSLLKQSGIAVPWTEIAHDFETLVETLKDLQYPIVLKINSRDIAHKSEAGGVRLNIGDAHEAKRVYGEIMESCRTYNPNAKLDGVLISEMLPSGGQELIIGISNDEDLGPFILVGLGGVFTEVFEDFIIAPVPVNDREALNMLSGLKSVKLLHGYRGGAIYDEPALRELIVKVSHFAGKHKDTVRELDLNPVIVYPEGAGVAIADALALVWESSAGTTTL